MRFAQKIKNPDEEDLIFLLRVEGFNEKTIKEILKDQTIKIRWQQCIEKANYYARRMTDEMFMQYLNGRITGHIKIDEENE